ncbi:cAMP-specific 3',5'-cyclic phosphodiesterase 4C [Clarias magur]|uniref:cAMP-specific 3',5'-cyclic phosphodiesterase 4C n=1 Tax=Clarias magur TaxID=1594786 RepID=A0A8J4XHK4_CLAMG|nr:cAMP-specific 3',5'-cyclic phosphodiesterase 4C [Clarias magur]
MRVYLRVRVRRRDSLGFCAPELVPKPSYAVRRRFSGPLLLPPLSRRHSILDTKKLLDLEALYKSALANLETQDLNVINNEPRSVIVHSSRHSLNFKWR